MCINMDAVIPGGTNKKNPKLLIRLERATGVAQRTYI